MPNYLAAIDYWGKGTPKCPVIIDVSIDEGFDLDPYLIPSARRHPHKKITDLVTELQDKKVIVICQKGLKLSVGAAAILRSHGIDAESLEDGNYAWRDAGQPRIPDASHEEHQHSQGDVGSTSTKGH